jgi:hypothetical protein
MFSICCGNSKESGGIRCVSCILAHLPTAHYQMFFCLESIIKSPVINRRFLICRITSEVSLGCSDLIFLKGQLDPSRPFLQYYDNSEVFFKR